MGLCSVWPATASADCRLCVTATPKQETSLDTSPASADGRRRRSGTEPKTSESRGVKPERCGYLSKFSPGLLFFHSSVSHQVVEDFACKRENRGSAHSAGTTSRSKSVLFTQCNSLHTNSKCFAFPLHTVQLYCHIIMPSRLDYSY